jgi:hypothetical protein
VIGAPIEAVYQTLVNVDKRPEWLDGVDTIDREMTSEPINMRAENDQHRRVPRFLRQLDGRKPAGRQETGRQRLAC